MSNTCFQSIDRLCDLIVELRHLRYFVQVADELHFGRAARTLGMSQPPLSQAIRALEQELGVVLLSRTSRSVELTQAGRLFLDEARRTLDQAAHAALIAQRAEAGEVGELAIGFVVSVPFMAFVAGALSDVRAAHPAVHLSLSELSRRAQIARLQDGTLDIGFVRGFDPPALPPGLAITPLLEEALMLAIARDHPLARLGRPLTLADVADEPFVLYDREMGAGVNEHVALLFRRAGREFLVAQEVSGLASLLGLIAAGFGVSVLVRSLAALHTEQVAYVAMAEPDAVSRLWLVHGERPSPAARRFIDLVLARRGES